MTHTEDRLRDLFEAIDEQLDGASPAPYAYSRGRRRVSTRLLAVAAAVVVALGAVAVWTTVVERGDGGVQLDVTIDPADFDARAEEICVALDRARNGVMPRFRTADAYLVVAADRRRAIDAAIEGLLTIPEPVDDGALPAAVVSRLRTATVRLSSVEDAAREGRLDDAASAWVLVDLAIDDALEPLGRRGTGPCTRQED